MGFVKRSLNLWSSTWLFNRQGI